MRTHRCMRCILGDMTGDTQAFCMQHRTGILWDFTISSRPTTGNPILKRARIMRARSFGLEILPAPSHPPTLPMHSCCSLPQVHPFPLYRSLRVSVSFKRHFKPFSPLYACVFARHHLAHASLYSKYSQRAHTDPPPFPSRLPRGSNDS